MFKYLLLVFSIFGSVRIFPCTNLKSHSYYSNQAVAMVQLCGNFSSTPPDSSEVDDFEASKNQIQGCYTQYHRAYHHDGSSTRVTIITCNKTEILDRNDKVKKAPDLASPRYQKQLNSFLGNDSRNEKSRK